MKCIYLFIYLTEYYCAFTNLDNMMTVLRQVLYTILQAKPVSDLLSFSVTKRFPPQCFIFSGCLIQYGKLYTGTNYLYIYLDLLCYKMYVCMYVVLLSCNINSINWICDRIAKSTLQKFNKNQTWHNQLYLKYLT